MDCQNNIMAKMENRNWENCQGKKDNSINQDGVKWIINEKRNRVGQSQY